MTLRDGVSDRSAESPLSWRLAEVVRLGWREYRALNPLWIVVGTTAPRAVLQILFFTVLGAVVAGADHRQYAFVGGLAVALSGTNVLYVSNVPVSDKESATFWRIRTGRLHPAAVFFARSLPYPLFGFGMVVIGAVIVAPMTGLTALAVQLLPLLWLYALMSCTSTAAGLVAASLAVGKRADVLASNLLAYVIMLCSGAFLPPGRLPWVDAIGSVLPVRHGLLAVHDALAGRPWIQHAAVELAVGVAWAAFAVVVIAVQIRRAHRSGHDDFD